MTALLVEDEAHLGKALKIAFRKLGIEVRVVTTLQEARLTLTQFEPELVVLDRELPDGDGLSLCTELRARDYSGAILMLTARGEVEARVEGLRSGADDYLPKPFSWEELAARIEALTRRTRIPKTDAKPNEISSGGDPKLWTCEEKRLRIRGPRGWVELTPLEYKLAQHLIGAQGEIVTREALLKQVWGFTLLPKTRTVDHFLGRLRKAFETNPEEPKHFLTVRGAGYRFNASDV
jgi:two-component system alkaline phosphatase synthesis response regulator PhoP